MTGAVRTPKDWLSPNMASQPSSPDGRVEDYMNDKLQTTADLESLDSLLDNVQKQHKLLEQQVCVHLLKLER